MKIRSYEAGTLRLFNYTNAEHSLGFCLQVFFVFFFTTTTTETGCLIMH